VNGFRPDNEKKYEELVRQKLIDMLRDTKAKIFLFGSRARGDSKRGSDADIGIEAIHYDAFRKLKIEFNEFWEESLIPFHVELIYFDQVSSDFKKQALKDIVVWKAD